MERSLLWCAFAVGCIGALCGPILARMGSSRARLRTLLARPFVIAAAILPLLVYIVTLLKRPPATPGYAWGTGYLLGGICVLFAGYCLLRAARGVPSYLGRTGLLAAPLALAVAAVCVPLLTHRTYPTDWFIGIAMGWTIGALLLVVAGHRHIPQPGEPEQASFPATFGTLLATGTGFTATACVVAALGILRDSMTPMTAPGTWSAVGLSLAAAVPLGLIVAAILCELVQKLGRATSWMPAVARTVGMAVGLAMMFALAHLLATKAVTAPGLRATVAAGLLLGVVLWWLARGDRSTEDDEGGESGDASPAMWLGGLVMLCGFMLASKLQQGFGVAALLMAAWLVAYMAMPAVLSTGNPSERPMATAPLEWLSRALIFGAGLLLYRLFDTMGSAQIQFQGSLDDYYAVAGLLAGVAVPPAVAGVLARRGTKHAAGMLGSFAASVVLALAIPGAILMFMGSACATPLVIGLAFSAVAGSGERRATARVVAPMLALLVMLAMIRWTGTVLPLAAMTRSARVRLLAEVAAAVVALVLLSDYGERVASAWKRRAGAVAGGPTK